MQKNDLIRRNGTIYRVIELGVGKALVIDCVRLNMPFWVLSQSLKNWETITFEELLSITNKSITI